MINPSRYLFIFNPAADKGRAVRRAGWLQSLLGERKDSAMVTTNYAGHAGEIARSEMQGSSALIACGGDGTLHEVVNAVAEKGVTVGMVPIGSANDFFRNLYAGSLPPSGINHLFDGGVKRVDLGSVSFGGDRQRYFINSLGVGLTGRIAKSVKGTQWLKGELAYVYALLSVLMGYQSIKMRITITLADSVVELDEPVFAFSVLNGKVEGGKFRIAPHAELSDGLLDVCILKAIPKYAFFWYVLKYLQGTHITDRRVLYCKARAVELTLENADVMHMDGEVYDNINGKIAISVVPKGVPVLCNLRHDADL